MGIVRNPVKRSGVHLQLTPLIIIIYLKFLLLVNTPFASPFSNLTKLTDNLIVHLRCNSAILLILLIYLIILIVIGITAILGCPQCQDSYTSRLEN